jgi:hypothetical protein
LYTQVKDANFPANNNAIYDVELDTLLCPSDGARKLDGTGIRTPG